MTVFQTDKPLALSSVPNWRKFLDEFGQNYMHNLLVIEEREKLMRNSKTNLTHIMTLGLEPDQATFLGGECSYMCH